MIMSPSENTNTPQSAAPEPKKEGFFAKIAGLFKKKQSAVAVPPGFTSQTPEPRLDNMGADGASVAIPGATPPQASPLADVALAQITTPPAVDAQPVAQPVTPVAAPVTPAVAPLVDPLSPVPQPQVAPVVQPVAPVAPVAQIPTPVTPVAAPAAPAGAVPSPFGPAPAQPVQPQQPVASAAPQPAPQFPPQQPPTPGV